jgi:anti-anti-sigma regulatory factor
MLKISLIDSHTERRLVLEGKLIAPWAVELKAACENARRDLDNRELIIDMKHVMTISQEGENVLLEFMNEGVKFHCRDVFTKHVLKELSRRTKHNLQEAK